MGRDFDPASQLVVARTLSYEHICHGVAVAGDYLRVTVNRDQVIALAVCWSSVHETGVLPKKTVETADAVPVALAQVSEAPANDKATPPVISGCRLCYYPIDYGQKGKRRLVPAWEVRMVRGEEKFASHIHAVEKRPLHALRER